VRTQSDRDQQTLNIASAGAIFLVILVVGLVLVLASRTTLGLTGDTSGSLFWVPVVCASLVSLWYLVRHRRP